MEDIGTTNLLEYSYIFREVYNLLWSKEKSETKCRFMKIDWEAKLVVKKLPREFLNSIPVIKIEKEEDPEKFLNWIVEDEFEENSEFNIENFLEEDTRSEMEENVEMNLSG